VETTASRHGTPNLAALGKIARVVGKHYMGIKGVSALLTIAVGIIYSEFFLFAQASDSF
jgi:hypothetical protein